MTRRTITGLLAQANANLADNTSHDISAQDVRDMVKDMLDTLGPGYCLLTNLSVTLPLVGATPVVVPMNLVLLQTPDYTSVLASGSITRLAGGLPATNNKLAFQADVGTASGAEVLFQLYKDNVAVPGGSIITAQGAANSVQAVFIIGSISNDGANHVYTVKVSKTTGAAADITLTNVRFTAEYIPTITP